MATEVFDVEELGYHICLAGPSLCGKSSLLFQHAVSCAEKGQSVVFIAPQPLVQLPLLARASTQPSQKVLNRIHFKYPSTLSALQDVFDCAHLPGGLLQTSQTTGAERMACLIIDDFHQYFVPYIKSNSYELTDALVKTCAHITDCLSFITTNSTDTSYRSPAPVTCILSLTHSSCGTNLDVVRRWFPSLLAITESGHNQFTIEKQGHPTSSVLVSYSIQQTCFEIFHSGLNRHQI